MNRSKQRKLLERLAQTAEMDFYRLLQQGVVLNGTLPPGIRRASVLCLETGCLKTEVATALRTARRNSRRLYHCYQQYQRRQAHIERTATIRT